MTPSEEKLGTADDALLNGLMYDDISIVDSDFFMGDREEQTEEASKKRRKGYRKPKDAPRRPLSGYNLMFVLERERIISGYPEREFTAQDVEQAAIQQKIQNSKPKPKRKHRKTHGRISFGELARTIANKWKKMEPERKKVFEDRAALEKKLYKDQVQAWIKSKKERKDKPTHQHSHTNANAHANLHTHTRAHTGKLMEEEQTVPTTISFETGTGADHKAAQSPLAGAGTGTGTGTAVSPEHGGDTALLKRLYNRQKELEEVCRTQAMLLQRCDPIMETYLPRHPPHYNSMVPHNHYPTPTYTGSMHQQQHTHPWPVQSMPYHPITPDYCTKSTTPVAPNELPPPPFDHHAEDEMEPIQLAPAYETFHPLEQLHVTKQWHTGNGGHDVKGSL